MSQKIRVLIADDHPIVRQGLGVVLTAQLDMELVAEATDGQEAVDLAQETQPDVIIMDLMMPVKDGLTAIKEIDRFNLSARILVLTSFPENNSLPLNTLAGSAAYVFLRRLFPIEATFIFFFRQSGLRDSFDVSLAQVC